MAARTKLIRRAGQTLLGWLAAGSVVPAMAYEAPPPLTDCPDCREACVHPLAWEERGDTHWWISLRCGACCTCRDVVVPNEAASVYDEALDRQAAEIKRAADKLDRERMAGQLEAFVAALHHDLIDASSFA